MTIQEFDQLTDPEKEENVLNAGTFLSTHNDGYRLFDTYQYESFYVLFFYKIIGKDLTVIRTFNDSSELIFLDNLENILLN